MEREEFKILVKGMKAVYANPTFIPDQDAFNVWYELLKDIPYKLAEIAIQKHMLTEKFPPTIADIRTKATEIVDVEEISELAAWSMVYKAICNSGYNSVEEYEKLPPIVQKAVGDPANLREWASMDEKMISSVRARFIDSFKIAEKRMKDDAKLPNHIKALIDGMRQEKAAEIEAQRRPKIEAKTADPPEERISSQMGETVSEKLKKFYEDFGGKGVRT